MHTPRAVIGGSTNDWDAEANAWQWNSHSRTVANIDGYRDVNGDGTWGHGNRALQFQSGLEVNEPLAFNGGLRGTGGAVWNGTQGSMPVQTYVPPADPRLIPVQHADAQELADALGPWPAEPRPSRAASALWLTPGTNSIRISGGSEAELARIRNLVRELDTTMGADRRGPCLCN